MNLYKTHPFQSDGSDYQINIFYDEHLINVVVFKDNYPHNGIRHQIHIPKQIDVKKVLKSPVIEEFIEMSRKDITTQRWQKLLT